jgi:uncharacterized membrane protein
MMTDHQHPLVVDYLNRLAAEARCLPSEQAHELIADIEEHLSAGLPPDATEADVRNVLDRLGTPQELVAAAAPPVPLLAAAPARSGWIEAGALIGLLAAEVLFIVLPVSILAWLVGLVLLAVSNVWSLRQKMVGFAALGTGFVAAWLAIGLSLVASSATMCSDTVSSSTPAAPPGSGDQIDQTVSTCGNSGMTWANYLAIGLTVGYIVFQIYALWMLTRAARRQHGGQPRSQLA